MEPIQPTAVDPQELLKLYNHLKGAVKMLGLQLGRDVVIVERDRVTQSPYAPPMLELLTPTP